MILDHTEQRLTILVRPYCSFSKESHTISDGRRSLGIAIVLSKEEQFSTIRVKSVTDIGSHYKITNFENIDENVILFNNWNDGQETPIIQKDRGRIL